MHKYIDGLEYLAVDWKGRRCRWVRKMALGYKRKSPCKTCGSTHRLRDDCSTGTRVVYRQNNISSITNEKREDYTMKKLLCCLLVAVFVLGSIGCALAESGSFSTKGKLGKGVGTDASTANLTKSGGIGSAGSGKGTTSPSNALFQGTVRKLDGTNASNAGQFSGSNKSFTMTTRYDGYGNALLRPTTEGGTQYYYKLRVAHRSNSPVSQASATGTWNP